MSEKLIVVRTLEQLKELELYVQDKEYVAYDTETTGVDKDSHVIGLSVCAEVDIAYYVILSYWDVATQKLVDVLTINEVRPLLLTLQFKHLIMHNAPFDCSMTFNNFQVELMPSVHTDTLVLGHLLDENRSNGLKELGVSIFGEDARAEQTAMKESVHANGGLLTKDKYELYKADADLLAKYGAKDAILTLKLFYHLVPELYEQRLDQFFYEDESMPLLRGPTYDMNTTGLRVDPNKLTKLKGELEASCLEAKAFIHAEILTHVKSKYPGTGKTNVFNIGASQQLSWLLFSQLGEEFIGLTDGGKELCKALEIKPPYAPADKRNFIRTCLENKDRIYGEAIWNPKTHKMGRPKKVRDWWSYVQFGKSTIEKYSKKYAWVKRLGEHNKNLKLLNTYVEGIQSRMRYNIIRPNFLQIGTTSGRYSCKNPNFQNLPRDDKRVKACIVSRPGKVFVGADYSQLEPRVFASISQDETLMECFAKGEDFYSVVGAPIFHKTDCSMIKSDKDSFAEKYPKLRHIAKAFALATPYGTGAFRQSRDLGLPTEECQNIIDSYFAAYPKVELMMLESHEKAKANGVVHNLFGRPRRIPAARDFNKIYGNALHADLPYEARTVLNLSMNHVVQSTGASIVNRASIQFYQRAKDVGLQHCRLVMQVHDEIIVECLEEDATYVAALLKDCMESTTELPGVQLIAEPKVAKNLGDLK